MINLPPLTSLKTLQDRRRKKLLSRQYHANTTADEWPPIPPPEINYNQVVDASLAEYVGRFRGGEITSQMSFLKQAAELKPNSVTLDFGCGLGRLASSFAMAGPETGTYFGYEPEPQAVAWLKAAYVRDTRFSFGGKNLPPSANYVTNKNRRSSAEVAFRNRVSVAPTAHDLKSLLGDTRPTLQFSMSVFTHMWPDDVEESLEILTNVCSHDATFVNTWLLLDDFSMAEVAAGRADRHLPISVGGIRTYSERNPLVCTAFPLEKALEIYERCGHQVIEVLPGSWAGRDNGVTYQDIIISRRS